MRLHLWGVLAAAAGALAACATSSTTGPDRSSRSDATSITWSDGKPAYAISCENPGGCQERALAMCRQGNYTTLDSKNMPTVGTYREVFGKPSVVIRCS
ncbi:hypothetical protein [Bradyrhizobium sp. NBAIM08]|uniref:hypothetical protein n=1 Tax=Bradyrhizobium sp. NBAIM08 TaxID=2793815 RepID=UPI001CD70FF8|nr:hypothetical protein [Bradyrhizobium sp. NBAIM08]MCA1481097.1 hypothetical protein [Bradyrhizobium sp. NBAIM08]